MKLKSGASQKRVKAFAMLAYQRGAGVDGHAGDTTEIK
jgi:hypothetical protein